MRYLSPLSYITELTGCCTLIGTSTNRLVDDMASAAGQARFVIFEITPVGLPMAVARGLYLFLAGSRLLNANERDEHEGDPSPVDPLHIASAQVGDVRLFTGKPPLHTPHAVNTFVVDRQSISYGKRT